MAPTVSHTAADRAFEWDEDKAAVNAEKHGIAFEDAAAALVAGEPLVERDPHPKEQRWRALARVGQHVMMVVFTLRQGQVRLISARPASTKERMSYGEHQNQRLR